MNNQVLYIPSGGVGEISLNLTNQHWYKVDSTFFN